MMSTVKIEYSELQDAAKKCSAVSERLDGYADEFPKRISQPLNSLSGGVSANTSNAASLAQEKAKQLRDRAYKYKNLSLNIIRFEESAKSTDSSVGRRLGRLADKRAEDLSWWDKIKYNAHKYINSKVGDDEVAKVIKDCHNVKASVEEHIRSTLKDVGDYFVHGNGRYIIEALSSVLGAITAVLAIATFFPIAGIVGAILLGLAIFVAIDKVVDAGITLAAAYSTYATGIGETDPGLARYTGSTNSLSTYANRFTTNKGFQTFAKWEGAAADVADVIVSLSGLAAVKNAEGVTTGYKLDGETIKMNLNRSIGREPKINEYTDFGKQPPEVTKYYSKTYNYITGEEKLVYEKWNPGFFNIKIDGSMELKDYIKSSKSVTNFVKSTSRIKETINSYKKGTFSGIVSGVSGTVSILTGPFTSFSLPSTIVSPVKTGVGIYTTLTN